MRRGLQFEQKGRQSGAGLGAVVCPGKQLEAAAARLVAPDGTCATGLGMEQVRRDRLALAGHRERSSDDSVKGFHRIRRSEAAPGTNRGKQNLLRLKGF